MEVAHRVLVVGDGGWGTALAMVLPARGRAATLWSHDPEYAALMRETHTNPRFLPGFDLDPSIRIGSGFADLLVDTELVVSAVPTAYLRAVWEPQAHLLPPALPVLSVSKGLEERTLLRPTQILEDVLGPRPIAVLSGPNIAREIAHGQPAATVASSRDGDLTHVVQRTFSGPNFRIYANPDPLGVELGGVLKNVIAIAAGLCDGLKLGANAKASLITRGVIEMARLGERLGGQRRTFFGMAGLGDLLTTCYSPASRNRTFGERLGRGERAIDIQESMNMVAEGVKTSAPVHTLMHEHDLQLPISEQVYYAIHEGKSAREVLRSLMDRAMRDEAEDRL
ncbi:MAG: NAD(P)H-dependent glycerol-3-phosphate dehydrogenase [Planctomycetota bacterium]